MILFMVSIDTWLNENLLLILNFCFTVFILQWKANFFIIKLIVSFPDDIEVFSDQLKRFNESVIDPKCLLYWKLQRHPFVLITIYPFQATLYFLVYYYFYLRSAVYMLIIIINTAFLKLLQFGLFIQICQQVSFSLKHDNATRIFLLICLVSQTWSDHYLLPQVLIKIGFLVHS